MVVAETVTLTRANRLRFVDVDIVPVGGSRTGSNHADVQAWAAGDQLAKAVARAMHGCRRIVLAKERGAPQEFEQIVRFVAEKIEALRDLMVGRINQSINDAAADPNAWLPSWRFGEDG